MSLNGLVHPEREKCESQNWRWIRAHQLGVQGLGPIMDTTNECNYGNNAPYVSPKVQQQMDNALPFRVWGYPNVTQCSKLAPLLYAPRVDPNPKPPSCPQCSVSTNNPSWPKGFYCGHSLSLEKAWKGMQI